jgi:hypothetical protein
MEERKAKIQYAKSGRGSLTTRMTLPITWVRTIGVSEDDREVKISLKDNKIIIEKD